MKTRLRYDPTLNMYVIEYWNNCGNWITIRTSINKGHIITVYEEYVDKLKMKNFILREDTIGVEK